MKKYKFLIKNILTPTGKVTISIGNSATANKLLTYFNSRSWKRAFIKLKKYNIALLPIDQFSKEEDYLTSVNGKNSAAYFSRRCSKLGYTFQTFNPNHAIDAIFEINTSSSERQGRAMEESYNKLVSEWPCDEIHKWFGIYSSDGKLVAYVWTYIVGEMVLINRILGHGDFLKDNIMYLLMTSVVSEFIQVKESNFIMYDTFGQVENGLVLFKKRIGFKPYTVNFKQ
jgi:hypothetical protein